MLTIEDDGKRYIMTEARYNSEFDCWEWPYEAGADYWRDVDYKVTHWMKYPSPAED